MSTNDESSFGKALRLRRRESGLSQRELADRTGLDFSYLSKLENDRLPPPAADTVVRICDELQIPSEELLALSGKIPSRVQQAISTNKAAQRFLLTAEQLSLTEQEWERMAASLQQLRDD